MKNALRLNFNTISGPTEVTWSREEALNSEFRDIYISLIGQRDHGVIGGTYNTKYGKIEFNLIEEAN